MRVTFCWIFVLNLPFNMNARLPRNRHLEKRRAPSAFQLARIQRDYDADYENEDVLGTTRKGKTSLRRDEVVSDALCLERCNRRLNIGMDMVNAHMAFGSIDVPSVMERHDLELFCLLDRQHTICVDECGYSVQFNLREYVCRKRFNEMATHLPCYARAAPSLSRHCRPRCGEYTPLEHTLQGYAHRCRQLLCDHACTNFILNKLCPPEEGQAAGRFLLDFTRMQVSIFDRFFRVVASSSEKALHGCGESNEMLYGQSCHVSQGYRSAIPRINRGHTAVRKRAILREMEFGVEVDYWVKDYVRTHNVSLSKAYPASCARLRCDNFNNRNCARRKRLGV